MIEWVPWIVWAEFVGVACVIVGAWGLLRLKRRPLVQREADEIVAMCEF